MWAQEIWLPVQAPLVSSRLVMHVLDHDTARSNDFIGSMAFELYEILQTAKDTGESPWIWKSIYGPPIGVSGKHTNEMKRTPEIASSWNGRVLMQIVCEEADTPKMKIQNVTEDTMKESAEYMKLRTYEVKTEISQGICLPRDNLRVKIKMAEFEFVTEEPKVSENLY